MTQSIVSLYFSVEPLRFIPSCARPLARISNVSKLLARWDEADVHMGGMCTSEIVMIEDMVEGIQGPNDPVQEISQLQKLNSKALPCSSCICF